MPQKTGISLVYAVYRIFAARAVSGLKGPFTRIEQHEFISHALSCESRQIH